VEKPILEIKNLKTYFFHDEGIVKAVDGVSFNVHKGEFFGIVGESGSGKSVTILSILQLIDEPGRIVDGEILYRKNIKGSNQKAIELTSLSPKGKQMRSIRGSEIALIFQEPMTAFSPVHTIGAQIIESINIHRKMKKEEAKELTIDLLDQVGLSSPAQRFDEYPHQLSGGMRQRAFIAMALSCDPSLLIADEPTTAIDVTIQAQILELLERLKEELSMSVILITHDLGVIAETAERVGVMYLGKLMELSSAEVIFKNPHHPYTQALLNSMPSLEVEKEFLDAIEGVVPDPLNLPSGCLFHPRCKKRIEGCNILDPEDIEIKKGHLVKCLKYRSDQGE